MTTARARILDAAEELVTAGQAPTLDAVAAAAGVSKGGLLYHFGKQSLLQALVVRAVEPAAARLADAAAAGHLAAAWLRLSVPDHAHRLLYRGILSMLRLTTTGGIELPEEVTQAEARWDRMLADEVGDPVRARLVRRLGDGLFLAALTGQPPTADEVDALIAHLGLVRAGAP